jgi:phage tail sheath gpL-like
MFTEISDNIRVPYVAAEYRAASTTQEQPFEVLFIGQNLSSGSAADGSVELVQSREKAIELYGRGSDLALMFEGWFNQNSFIPAYGLNINDLSSGVAATGNINFSGTASASGEVNLYIDDRLIKLGVSKDATAASIANDINNLINSNLDLQLSSAVDGTDNEQLNLTAKHKGTLGNEIALSLNYYSTEQTVTGLSITLTQMTGGAGAVDLDSYLVNIPAKQYNLIGFSMSDTRNLNKLIPELDERQKALKAIQSYAVSIVSGSLAQVQTAGNAVNSAFLGLFASNSIPSAKPKLIGSLVSQIAHSAVTDPGIPFTGLILNKILAPKPVNQYEFSERNTLLYSGVSTLRYNSSRVEIEKAITTYKKDSTGDIDTRWLYANIPLTLDKVRFRFVTRLKQKYERYKLAQDGSPYKPNSRVVTPSRIKAEVVSIFRSLEADGLVQDYENFVSGLVVEIDQSDSQRLNLFLPISLIKQLDRIAISIEFN